MIGYCRLSVCLSVRLPVTLCIVAKQLYCLAKCVWTSELELPHPWEHDFTTFKHLHRPTISSEGHGYRTVIIFSVRL